MIYKRLGKSGLKVSSLCFGTMTFGDGADEAESGRIYGLCRDSGINVFDCADVYADGVSERILGRLIRDHRDDVILATKAYYPVGGGVNERGLSRYHLTKALEGSLKRLGTDYVDVYYMHAFDEETPLEESLMTLNDFVRQGKVLYLGISNFAAWQIMKAMAITEAHNLAPVTCIQPMYNLLKRQCESEILPMAQSEGLGVLPYGPVAGGYLTGKYLKETSGKGRFETDPAYQKRYQQAQDHEAAERFVTFAKENGYHPVSLAIAWVASHPAVTAPLIGARSAAQLGPALASLDIDMDPELQQTVSNLSLAPALATDREEER